MELFVPPIANLKPASTLALDDDFAVPSAQFDLTNVSARAVNLFGDQSRALWASVLFTSRYVLASVDAERLRFGIEIGLQHKCVAQAGRASALWFDLVY